MPRPSSGSRPPPHVSLGLMYSGSPWCESKFADEVHSPGAMTWGLTRPSPQLPQLLGCGPV